MKRKYIWILLAVMMAWCAGCMSSAEDAANETETGGEEAYGQAEEDRQDMRAKGGMGKDNDGMPEKGGMRGGGNGGGMAENDEEAQAVIDENAEKFSQFTFTDEENGISFEYSLYIPEGYEEDEQYPLIMFIPDSTGSGKSAKEIVEQYYGADVWATAQEQEKHASFVLVPAFTETVVDDSWYASEQIETVIRLIGALQEEYSIDANRLYTTGQSMGCMTSLYLNSQYPDLFAASMYVSGQWDISALSPLEEQKFFYITAGGDEKSSGGQDEVMAMFDQDGCAYTYDTWDAQNEQEEQEQAVAAMLENSTDANMIRFETGSVLKEGENSMEHMASFNYGYKLATVRDWLFEQSK